jgi:hypothetical protein
LINVIIREFANGSVSSLRFRTGYRKNYIQRIKIHSESSNKSIQEFLVWSIKEQIETVYFLRAIQEEFGVDVEKMLREDVDII